MFFEDHGVIKEVSDFFLKNLRISAAEYSHINAKTPFTLFGVEDQNLYQENLEAFRNSLSIGAQAVNTLKQIENALLKIKKTVYSSKLNEFSSKQKKFSSGTILPVDYYHYLFNSFYYQHKSETRKRFPKVAMLFSLFEEKSKTQNKPAINESQFKGIIELW